MKRRIGHGAIGVGIGLVLLASLIQGPAALAGGSVSSDALWVAIAGVAAIFGGIRLALERPPGAVAVPLRELDVAAGQPTGGRDRDRLAAVSAIALASLVVLIAVWTTAPPGGGLIVVFVGVPAWAVFVPSVIAVFGELVKRREHRRGGE